MFALDCFQKPSRSQTDGTKEEGSKEVKHSGAYLDCVTHRTLQNGRLACLLEMEEPSSPERSDPPTPILEDRSRLFHREAVKSLTRISA
ncbi:phosphoinositide 3-kinase regulatory subunit 4 [Moniliophthora roreri]|nr:phosphoinositide 3-kinase regulatory subunit 4 [Moniliophthora roreri]